MKPSPEALLVFDIVFQLFRQREVDCKTNSCKPSSRMFFFNDEEMDDGLLLENVWEESSRVLSEKEIKVLKMYYEKRMLLKEIGKAFGVSISRASELRMRSLLKLGKKIRRVCPNFFNIMRPFDEAEYQIERNFRIDNSNHNPQPRKD